MDLPIKDNTKKIICPTLQNLPMVAFEVLEWANDFNVWVLEGDMGAGKTTFIKAICAHLGVVDTVNSPTFSIVNEYHTHSQQPIYHFDFYRIKNEMEAVQIGCEDYFYSGNFCFLEWASRIPSLIPDAYLHIHFSIDDTIRILTINKHYDE